MFEKQHECLFPPGMCAHVFTLSSALAAFDEGCLAVTQHGNARLWEVYEIHERRGSGLHLLFSVHRTSHFCGVARMATQVDGTSKAGDMSLYD